MSVVSATRADAAIDGMIDVVVSSKTVVADGVVLLELARPGWGDLPAWQAGAHIDVLLGADGLERQYSLCGERGSRGSWQIGVLREPTGRGGSVRVHDDIEVGQLLRARGPRNHFGFDSAAATRALFIAGGIGITPIRAMIAEAEAAGIAWELVYAGRSRSTMAFVEELSALYGDRVRVFASDEGNRVDVAAILAVPRLDTAVYCCGPVRLMDAVEIAIDGQGSIWPRGALHLERFEPKHVDTPDHDSEFEVELELSGVTLTVPADRTILDVVEEAGVLVLSSCREGTCGTCETPVISGEVDHRDSVLTADEQAENTAMMICVSRASCARLVLEL